MPDKFSITDTVSTADWESVDKSRIWRLLKQGIEESTEGIVAAVREVYAVVKAAVNEDLALADCWGPKRAEPDTTAETAGGKASAKTLPGT